MPISNREIVEGAILRQIAEYPLLTTINKVTQNVYQINDKLLVIKELKGERGEYEVEFDSKEFEPFYSSHDFYIALTYKSWGRGGFLLTPKDVKRLLSLEEGENPQTLAIKSIDDEGYEIENLITQKKLNRRIANDDFPRNFFGTVTLSPHIEDEFGWLEDDNEEDEWFDEDLLDIDLNNKSDFELETRNQNPKRFKKARADASIGTIQNTVELVFGLPKGSVYLCDVNGDALEANSRISDLREIWE